MQQQLFHDFASREQGNAAEFMRRVDRKNQRVHWVSW
jgi:hypothetical protein